jgi:tetratricopeptide (TPR) repeat protein
MNRLVIIPALLLACSLSLTISPARADDPVTMNNYGLELLNKGEVDRAVEQLQKAYSYFPYDAVIKKNLAVAYTVVARQQMKQSKFAEAVESLDRGLELAPEEPSFLIMKGIACYYLKRYDVARENLERGRAADPDAMEALYYLGWVSYDTDDLARAREYWEQALAAKPDSAELQRMLAKVKKELAVEPGMDKGHSSKFMVSYDAAVSASLAESVLSELESAYNRVGADLDHFPEARVPVSLYTAKDFKGVTQGPEWSGGVYDGKIRLPIGGVEEMNPHLRAILFHEYTHVVVFEITNGRCPTWLNEGLAEMQGRRELNPTLANLQQAAKEGRLIPWAQLEGPFGGLDSKQANIAYQESYEAVNFLVSTYGWFKVKQLLKGLGNGLSTAEAFARTFADYGLDYQGVEKEWRASLLGK